MDESSPMPVRRFTLKDYVTDVQARRGELASAGVELPTDEELRNKGQRRTAEKRELLRRVEATARATGVAPVKRYF
jgi:hypothetical protein